MSANEWREDGQGTRRIARKSLHTYETEDENDPRIFVSDQPLRDMAEESGRWIRGIGLGVDRCL